MEDHVKNLAKASQAAHDARDAMMLSQAALNVAHAMQILSFIKSAEASTDKK